MINRRSSSRARRARGFTLIEVLVALLVMAFGMLGIASLLLVTLRSNTSSVLKQQAVQSAYNVIDKVRANRTAAGSYAITDIPSSGAPTAPSAPSPDCSAATCTAAQTAAYDAWYWLANDVALLPLGAASITTAAAGTNTLVTVTVQWDDTPARQGAVDLGAAASSPSATSRLAQITIATLL